MTTTRLRPLLLITTLREFLSLTVPILNYSFLLRIAAAGGQLVKVSTKPARDPVSVYLREVEGTAPPTPFKPSLKSLNA